MAFVLADRVQETTTTTGTGTITLAGPVSGFQGFSAVGDGNSTYYTISNTAAAEWEVGIGTYTASGTTLSRTTVISSSNGGNAVDFSAGTKNVFCTSPASRSVLESDTGYIYAGLPSTNTGLVPMPYVYRLNSAVVGANVNTAQKIFGVGVTLASNTVYAFEIRATFLKTAGVTSHTIGFSFGGTATVNNIINHIRGLFFAGSVNTFMSSTNYQANIATVTTNVTASGAAAIAVLLYDVQARGTVSINAGGTFIPQYTLSAAPGGAYTTQIGSYCTFYPIGASGSNTNIGGWA